MVVSGSLGNGLPKPNLLKNQIRILQLHNIKKWQQPTHSMRRFMTYRQLKGADEELRWIDKILPVIFNSLLNYL
jgi:hypothetical protein